MSTWLETFGPNNSSAIMWIVLVLLVLVVLLVVLRLVRNMRGGTFIAGGRNRAPRLAVVDAAAVDAQRRLVLVRRDNVEHLILIGGPTDVVIEPGIQTGDLERALRERQMRAAEARPKRPTAAPKVEPAPASVQAPAVPPEPVHPRRHAVAVTPPEAEVVPEAPEPVTPPAPLPAQPQRVEPKMEPHVAPTPPAAEMPADTLDVVPSKKPSAQTPEAALETSLEEEMGRLLSDISVDDARQR